MTKTTITILFVMFTAAYMMLQAERLAREFAINLPGIMS